MIETTDSAAPAPYPTARVRHAVELAVEELDPATGVRTRHVVVGDESEASATREATQALIAVEDEHLRANPEWRPPDVRGSALITHHRASEWFYASTTIREWRTHLVPSAMALLPLQRPWVSHLPSGAEVDEWARRLFLDTYDAIGVRTRARVMSDVIERRTASSPASGRSGRPRARWVSLACGAAVPVLEALAGVAGTGEPPPHLVLVDADPTALAFAAELARQQGLVEEVDFTLLERNLLRGAIVRDDLVDELSEASALVVEALGIFEYFDDAACTRLLRNAYRLVQPGGVLVVANMLAGRPQLAMNERGVGWPRLYPRSVEGTTALVRAAGLPLERTTVHLPQDGVYAVVEVAKDR